MTALTQGRHREYATKARLTFVLTGAKVFQGSMLGMYMGGANLGKVTKYTAALALFPIGSAYLGAADRSVDATSTDKPIQVDLPVELQGLEWLPNGATPVTASHILQTCYFADDNTVVPGSADLGVTPAGRVLYVDAVKGVLVIPPNTFQLPARPIVTPGPTLAFTANDVALAQVIHGATYTIPTTGAASTVSLPSAASLPDGIEAEFFADGTANGHTVQYRDVATAITAALTASKRHVVRVTTRTGKWVAVSALAAP